MGCSAALKETDMASNPANRRRVKHKRVMALLRWLSPHSTTPTIVAGVYGDFLTVCAPIGVPDGGLERFAVRRREKTG
jgi:hypothetical protein